MKCPKCGYLGFEQAERCRNCGYEFALAERRTDRDGILRDDTEPRSVDDLDLIDGAASARPIPRTSTSRSRTVDALDEIDELPLFTDELSLISQASPPRPPLSVRRAPPDAMRPRVDTPTAQDALQEPEMEMPLDALISPAVRAHDPEWVPAAADVAAPAGLGARAAAATIDLGLLTLIDLAVVYLTLQICGLTPREMDLLPLPPLVAFLVVQNGGYLVAFTAGGQTIGKMVMGARVVASEPGQVLDLSRALQRTLVWAVMALPLGLGLLSALLTPDRRGFHDRIAGTRVVRAATT
ncbi:MAG: RDD family protein [Acidimicrobiia bacterium]|nr:RDD family protein [Acidimicrobiia bacterium]